MTTLTFSTPTMQIGSADAAYPTPEQMDRDAFFAAELIKAMRALLNAPLGDGASRDAVMTCRALLEMYDEQKGEVCPQS